MAEVKVVGNVPTRQTPGSAGFDLRAAESSTVPTGGIVSISTGTSLSIPDGHVGLVCSRSGLALKGVFVLNSPGVIDSDYRGELRVILANVGARDHAVVKGDRIAQLLVVRTSEVSFVSSETLDETQRGNGGFGSTGSS